MIWINLAFFYQERSFFSLMEDRKPIVFVLLMKAGYKYIIFSKINSRFSFFSNEMVIIRNLFINFSCGFCLHRLTAGFWLWPLSALLSEWIPRFGWDHKHYETRMKCQAQAFLNHGQFFPKFKGKLKRASTSVLILKLDHRWQLVFRKDQFYFIFLTGSKSIN